MQMTRTLRTLLSLLVAAVGTFLWRVKCAFTPERRDVLLTSAAYDANGSAAFMNDTTAIASIRITFFPIIASIRAAQDSPSSTTSRRTSCTDIGEAIKQDL